MPWPEVHGQLLVHESSVGFPSLRGQVIPEYSRLLRAEAMAMHVLDVSVSLPAVPLKLSQATVNTPHFAHRQL